MNSVLVIVVHQAFPVAIAEGRHLFPFRTEQLSPPAPMVLPGSPGGRVGRCRDLFRKALLIRNEERLFTFYSDADLPRQAWRLAKFQRLDDIIPKSSKLSQLQQTRVSERHLAIPGKPELEIRKPHIATHRLLALKIP